MNGFNQRQVVATLVMMAGLAGCAAQQTANACPPEDGATPSPAQQIEREVTLRGVPAQTLTRAVTLWQTPGVTISTASDDRDVVITRSGGKGSTLEARVYQPGEAMTVYGLKAAGDGPQRVLRVKENGRDIRVEQRGEKVTATIDGKNVPADAITVKDGTIEVRDAEGKTVLKEEWAAMDVQPRLFRGTGLAPGMTTLPGVTWGGNMDEESAPKVMLGITMDDADEELVEQLGLPEGDYAIIATVPDGLPACKAGLQPRDIVVSVDGKTPASSDTIREVMAKKKPGETLDVEVARKGTRIKLGVQLEAFDAKRFQAFGQTMSQDPKVWERYGKEMEEKAREMSRAYQSTAEAERLHRQLLAIPRDGGDGPMTFTIPGEGSAKLQSRLDAMEAQLERLEAMLRRLDARAGVPMPPVPPVPPVAPIAPSGGGGTPKPWFAAGL